MQEPAAKPSAKAARAAHTRAALLASARRIFAAKGFAATGTEDVVAAAKVTRGALYFHFADKTALFAAVLEECAEEIAAAILAAASRARTPLAALKAGARAYVSAAADPARARIYLADGPAALGVADWAGIENRHSLPLLIEGIRNADPGLKPDAAALMARLLSGAMIEAARAETAGARSGPVLDLILQRLFAAR